MDNFHRTTVPAVPDDVPPAAIPFFLHIQHVEYKEDPHEPPLVRAPEFYWRPSSSGQFLVEHSSGWWLWDTGQLTGEAVSQGFLRRPTFAENSRREHHKTSTLIWDPERHGYIHAPVDCTIETVNPDVWRRLSFGRRVTHNQADLAIIGYHRDDYRLHRPGPDSWFEQLLPDVYKAQVDEPPTCMLAGDLSILMGLLAFGVEPQSDYRAVSMSFRPHIFSTQFQRHHLPPSPRHKKRAMVIEIGYDPKRVTSEMLGDWERGDYGEIFS